MNRHFRKTFKALVYVPLAALLISILLVSPWGTRLLLSVTQSKVPGLEIEYASGGLSSTLHLHRFAWQNDLSRIEGEALSLNIDWSCVISLRLCLSEIAAEKIDVRVASSAQTTSPDSAAEKLTLPFPISIAALDISQISVEVVDTFKLEVASITSRLRMFKTLRIDTFSVEGTKIFLPNVEQSSTQKSPAWSIADISSWQYQPIDLPSLTFPLAVNAKNVELTNLVVLQGQQEVLAVGKIATALSLSQDKIKLEKLLVHHALGDLSVSGEFDSTLRHQISADLKVYPQANIHQLESAKVVLQGSPENLSIHLSSKGQLQLNAQLEVDLTSELLPLSGQLSWQGFTWPLTQPNLSSAAGKIVLQGDMHQYTLAIDADLESDNLPPTSISANLSGNNRQLVVHSMRATVLDGETILTGTLSVDEQLSWQGDVDFRHIQPQVFWPQLSANLNALVKHRLSFDGKNYQLHVAQLSADGSWQNYPFAASGMGHYDSNDGLDIPALLVKSGENSLQLKALIKPDQNIIASVDLTANGLNQLYPTIAGQGVVNAQISGSIKQPTLTFTATGQDLLFDQINVGRFISAGKLIWDEQKTVEVSSQISDVTIATLSFEDINLLLQGQAEQHTLDLALQSGNSHIQTQISGQLDTQQKQWAGSWDKGKISYLQEEFVLAGGNQETSAQVAILADWQNGHYQVAANCWHSVENENAKICITVADYESSNAAFEISGTKLPVFDILAKHFSVLKNATTSSSLSFDLDGNWLINSVPQFNLNAELTPSQWLVGKDQKPIDLRQFSLSAHTEQHKNSDQLNVLSKIRILGDQLGEVNANINLLTTPTAQNVSGEILLNDLQLHSLQSFVEHLDTMQGEIDGRMNISGTLDQPVINGQLNLVDGVFAGNILPANINYVDQTLTFAGHSAKLKGTFQLGNGLGEVEGTLDWRDELFGSLQVSGEKMEIDYQNIVRAKFSPDLQIEFSPQLLKVAGQVTVPYARVRVRELPQSAISVSKDVVVLNQPKSDSEETGALDLNIQLVIDPKQENEVKLDAFGLTSDLRGLLLLSQKGASLNANGEVSLVNGRYSAYGQKLLIRQGDIQFSGPIDNPFLIVEAVRDPLKTEDDVVAGIRLEGSTELLNPSIFSEPAMEQKEALSYLLRGKNINSTDETSNDAMLASALIGFGLGHSESRINKIGQKIGFEDLAIDTSVDGEQTQLSVSGYIAPGVQLRYGIGVFDSASEVALRYQLSSKLYLEAVSGLNNALDIYYQFSRTSEAQAAITKKIPQTAAGNNTLPSN